MLRHGLWDGNWGQYREAIEATLPVYLAGDIPLREAIKAILADLNPGKQSG